MTFVELQVLTQEVHACQACVLHQSRKQPVMGRGNIRSDLIFVGEAPGATEDNTGLPFCGKSGKILDKLIASIELSQDTVYILNIIKFRPPNNRRPSTSEMQSCKSFLDRQLSIAQPKLLVALGSTAIVGLCGPGAPISERRGKIEYYGKIPVLATYHPAATIYNPVLKSTLEQDIILARKILDHGLSEV